MCTWKRASCGPSTRSGCSASRSWCCTTGSPASQPASSALVSSAVLVLQGQELAEEAGEERAERVPGSRGTYHELAQPGLDVLAEEPAGAVPALGDQRRRVRLGPAP